MSGPDLTSVGDHFMIGLRPTATLDDRDRALLADIRPAGVVFFKSNFVHDAPYEAWLESHARLIADIRAAVGRDDLLIALDHEGGRVCRTPAPITRFSYAARWAGTSEAVGEAMGEELASLGFNLNFAPVLDVDSNPENPVIGERAFARTPEAVIEAALPFMRGMERKGVRACGKHFPGHGDTRTDSHQTLPVLNLSRPELEARELKPFRAAVEAGIGMVMTSHIVFTEIDPYNPATLSPAVAQGLLRDELGFEGVIVSDDVGMRAMDGLLDADDASARFMNAGNDLLMICSHFADTERARKFAATLVEARERGEVDEARLSASRARVARFLEGTARNEVRALPAEVLARTASAGRTWAEETVEVV